jgi:hypothetical protein
MVKKMDQLDGRINLKKNAEALERELSWFEKLLDTRVKLQVGEACDYGDVLEIEPPELDPQGSMYGNLSAFYDMNFAERLTFILALIPHIRPQMLDIFLTKNPETERVYTHFGGKTNGGPFGGFIPTGETLLFILAGEDLAKRFSFQFLFAADHFFARHDIVTLEKTAPDDPFASGALHLSMEFVDMVTTGVARKPVFGSRFPARLVQTAQRWDDLFLPSHTMDQVLEIKAWIQYGHTLLEELGLGKKVKPGYRALFYGQPGTGKTFTASLLGKVTGCDVYRIDLSSVVSKYIGETEKNLERIFSRAEHKEWILFFDEADALFGKRTDVKDAHDRFANQEVSYLLQRVEDFAGVVILSTNLRSNLDEAFTRRFQAIIHFPMPRPDDRRKIWENGFSHKTPLEPDVDLYEISEEFELSGGAIMNIVRYATLMALKEDRRTISLKDIRDGIKKEYRKDGRTM